MKSGSRPCARRRLLRTFFLPRRFARLSARRSAAALRLRRWLWASPQPSAARLAPRLECQTFFLSAAISSMVRPVTARVRHLFQDVRIGFLAGEFVGRLDQQPRLLPLAGPLAHPHQMPVAVELLAVQLEIEMALLHGLVRIVVRRPGAAIPDHHGAAAILALRDGAFELVVFDRMILDVDGEALVAGHEARAARHRPAQHHAVEFEAQIVVQPRRVVLLDDVAEALLARPGLAARLGGLAEVAFLPIGLQLAMAYRVSLRAWRGSDGAPRACAMRRACAARRRAPRDAISCCRLPRPSRCA